MSGDLLRRQVRLVLVDEHPNGAYSVLSPDGSSAQYFDDGSVLPDGPVGFQVPSDALPGLLAALSRHLGAVEHPEQLRRDYMAERARVDLLIGKFVGPA